MSQENVEILKRGLPVFNESGLVSEEGLSFFHDDAVFEEPPEQPTPGVARGKDAIAQMYRRFDETWEEHRSEPEEYRVLDDERVLLLSIEHFRGRDGIEITQPCGTLFAFRDGKITRMQSFWERENALKAAGLRD